VTVWSPGFNLRNQLRLIKVATRYVLFVSSAAETFIQILAIPITFQYHNFRSDIQMLLAKWVEKLDSAWTEDLSRTSFWPLPWTQRPPPLITYGRSRLLSKVWGLIGTLCRNCFSIRRFFMSAPAILSVGTDKTLFKLLIDELFQTGFFYIGTGNFALMNRGQGIRPNGRVTGGARGWMLYDKPKKRSKSGMSLASRSWFSARRDRNNSVKWAHLWVWEWNSDPMGSFMRAPALLWLAVFRNLFHPRLADTGQEVAG
jgi:hypothetical protein